jgi:hypothetical protein
LIGKFNSTELKSFSIEKSDDKATSPILELVLFLNCGFIIRQLSSKNIAFKINIILKIIKKRPPYIEISSFNSKIYYFSLNR